LQGDQLSAPLSVLATAKHFLGDGGTAWGSSQMKISLPPGYSYAAVDNLFAFRLDQGDTRLEEAALRAVHLPPYLAALRAGALAVMASLSSWKGLKLHAHHYLLTEVLKGELGFDGFIVSDWGGIDQVSDDYYQAVVTSINAGVDMSMVPYEFERFTSTIKKAVEKGDIPLARLDDAVRRILSVKIKLGLFERPQPDPRRLSLVGTNQHRELGREAVAKSLVLLKNEAHTLPLSKSSSTILVGGQAADDIGLQCGGWTIEWLGKSGAITPGTTILDGIRATISSSSQVIYDPHGQFELPGELTAEVGIAVLAEMPYAEGFGDREGLTLPATDIQLIQRMRWCCHKLVVILLSGRPLIITGQLPEIDALVAAWLPGTEGLGIADVLFGDRPFSGKLSYDWPASMDQVTHDRPSPQEGIPGPLFPIGYGL
jgi:beta-glucosidase